MKPTENNISGQRAFFFIVQVSIKYTELSVLIWCVGEYYRDETLYQRVQKLYETTFSRK